MGIRPRDPVRDTEFTLEIAKSADPVANNRFLMLGIVMVGVAFVPGSIVSNVLGT